MNADGRRFCLTRIQSGANAYPRLFACIGGCFRSSGNSPALSQTQSLSQSKGRRVVRGFSVGSGLYQEIVSCYVPLPGHSLVVLWALCGSVARFVVRGFSVGSGCLARCLGGCLEVAWTLLGGCLEVAKQPNGKSVGSYSEIMGCGRKRRRRSLLSNEGHRRFLTRRRGGRAERRCLVNGKSERLATKSPRH